VGAQLAHLLAAGDSAEVAQEEQRGRLTPPEIAEGH
jgi:hypothetical protein